MRQLEMFSKHQERCAICGQQFVGLRALFGYVKQRETDQISLHFEVCSIECANDAIKRLEENRRAKSKTDQWD